MTIMLLISVIVLAILIIRFIKNVFKDTTLQDKENTINEINEFINDNYIVYLNGIIITEQIDNTTLNDYIIAMVDYVNKKAYIEIK